MFVKVFNVPNDSLSGMIDWLDTNVGRDQYVVYRNMHDVAVKKPVSPEQYIKENPVLSHWEGNSSPVFEMSEEAHIMFKLVWR